MFEAEDLMNIASEPMSTRREPAPEGDWLGKCTDARTEKIEYEDKKTGEPRVMYKYTTLWRFDDPSVLNEMGKDRALTERMSFPIDVGTNDNGQPYLLDGPDDNVRLGAMRDALGLNHAGFRLGDTVGQIGICRVKQRIDKNSPDPENPDIYSDIVRILPPQ